MVFFHEKQTGDNKFSLSLTFQIAVPNSSWLCFTSSSEKDDQTIPNHGPCGLNHPYNVQKETLDIWYLYLWMRSQF